MSKALTLFLMVIFIRNLIPTQVILMGEKEKIECVIKLTLFNIFYDKKERKKDFL